MREVALALDRLRALQTRRPADAEGVPVERTSAGIQISAAAVSGSRGPLLLYTLSSAEAEMPAVTARALAQIIRRLRHPGASIDVIARKPGIYHFLAGGAAAPET